MNKNKFYVTTPLYYVNSKPHLGTLYTTVLADVSSRWYKLLGKKVFFLTGSDEHGQKIEGKAKELKLAPKEFVDSMVPHFKDVWKRYEISYDRFIRTTDEDHEDGVIALIKKLQDQGDIYKSTYTGLYCVSCETFVSLEKDAEKACPSCKRGLKEISEENYFFRLSVYEGKLLEFYEKNPDFIVPKQRLNEVVSFVKSGLQDFSISRKSVEWGISFPEDPTQTIYVWADALTNYISAIGYGSKDAKKQEGFNFWWPADLQIMGKDILRFHAIYWPAFLMAAELHLPKKLLVHGFILLDDEKMSKSRGNVAEPLELAKEYGEEEIRYYLLRHFSVGQDGHFEIEDLENHIAGDLANNLGNLLSRTIILAVNNKLDEVKPPAAFEPASLVLHSKCEEAFRNYWDDMSHCQYHIALSNLWNFISEVNVYFNNQKPWELAKEGSEFFVETISATCHCLYTIATLLWPVMPKKMERLLKHLGYSIDLSKDNSEELRKNVWNKTFKLTKPEEPLFVRPNDKKIKK